MVTLIVIFVTGTTVLITLLLILIPGNASGWGLFVWGFGAVFLMALVTLVGLVYSFMLFRSDESFFDLTPKTSSQQPKTPQKDDTTGDSYL